MENHLTEYVLHATKMEINQFFIFCTILVPGNKDLNVHHVTLNLISVYSDHSRL